MKMGGGDTENTARLEVIERDRQITALQAEAFSRQLREALSHPDISIAAAEDVYEPVSPATNLGNGREDEKALLAAALSSQAREIDLLRNMLASLVAERGNDANALELLRDHMGECGADSARVAIRRALKMTFRAVDRRIRAAIGLRKL